MTKDQIFEVIEENFNILAENNSGTTKTSQGDCKKSSPSY